MTLHSGAAKPLPSFHNSSAALSIVHPTPEPKTRNNSFSCFPASSPTENLPASLLNANCNNTPRKFHPSPRLGRDDVFRRPLPPTPERPRGGRSVPAPVNSVYPSFDECLPRMMKPEELVHSPKNDRKIQHTVETAPSGKRHSLPSLKKIFIRHHSASQLDPSAR